MDSYYSCCIAEYPTYFPPWHIWHCKVLDQGNPGILAIRPSNISNCKCCNRSLNCAYYEVTQKMRSHSSVDNDMNQPGNPCNPCNPPFLQYLMLQAPSAAETGLEMRSRFAQALTTTWTRRADHYLDCKITYGRTCHCNGLFDFTEDSLA